MIIMDINRYADFTNDVWKDPMYLKMGNLPVEPAILGLGLVGEAGEVVEKIKKMYHYNQPTDLESMKKELGDVVFYWARLCRWYGFDPSEVLDANVLKLEDRKERGVLHGNGDNR